MSSKPSSSKRRARSDGGSTLSTFSTLSAPSNLSTPSALSTLLTVSKPSIDSDDPDPDNDPQDLKKAAALAEWQKETYVEIIIDGEGNAKSPSMIVAFDKIRTWNNLLRKIKEERPSIPEGKQEALLAAAHRLSPEAAANRQTSEAPRTRTASQPIDSDNVKVRAEWPAPGDKKCVRNNIRPRHWSSLEWQPGMKVFVDIATKRTDGRLTASPTAGSPQQRFPGHLSSPTDILSPRLPENTRLSPLQPRRGSDSPGRSDSFASLGLNATNLNNLPSYLSPIDHTTPGVIPRDAHPLVQAMRNWKREDPPKDMIMDSDEQLPARVDGYDSASETAETTKPLPMTDDIDIPAFGVPANQASYYPSPLATMTYLPSISQPLSGYAEVRALLASKGFTGSFLHLGVVPNMVDGTEQDLYLYENNSFFTISKTVYQTDEGIPNYMLPTYQHSQKRKHSDTSGSGSILDQHYVLGGYPDKKLRDGE